MQALLSLRSCGESNLTLSLWEGATENMIKSPKSFLAEQFKPKSCCFL